MDRVTLRSVLHRDWPGLAASAITFGLFIMSTYLVALTQITTVNIQIEHKILISEVSQIKLQLMKIQASIDE